jgi:hypothetical protein
LSDDDRSIESGEEEKTNQIFNVREAVPPTDFDAPYSKMPPSVEKLMPRVKQKVIESYKTKTHSKAAEERKQAIMKRGKSKLAQKNKDLADMKQSDGLPPIDMAQA